MLKTPPLFQTFNGDNDAAADISASAADQSIWLRYQNNKVLVDAAAESVVSHPPSNNEPSIAVGRLGKRTVFAYSASDSDSDADSPPENTQYLNLRALFATMPMDWLGVLMRAVQLIEWDRAHVFCGACGTPTERAAHERARRCPSCGLSAYPRISPAMMCLPTRGREILLARNVNFPSKTFSALAGFLEAGETIEECIQREVMEEVAIEVKNPRYFGSQSWPFPHSLMIAFTAEYASGEAVPKEDEIAEVAWFDIDHLPQLPTSLSIARALIDDTVSKIRAGAV